MKSHGEAQYVGEFEVDRLVNAGQGVGHKGGLPEAPPGTGISQHIE